MLVAGENSRGYRLSARRCFCKRVGCFVEASWDVIEFQAIEPVLQPSDFLVVCLHLGVMELNSFMTWLTTSWESPLTLRRRMPSSMAIHRPLMSVLYSAILFDEGKWSQTMYLMWTPRGDTKTSPTPTPFFISDPSKYIVQYS